MIVFGRVVDEVEDDQAFFARRLACSAAKLLKVDQLGKRRPSRFAPSAHRKPGKILTTILRPLALPRQVRWDWYADVLPGVVLGLFTLVAVWRQLNCVLSMWPKAFLFVADVIAVISQVFSIRR